MIFDESHIGHRMMDFEFNHWLFMILGIGLTVILVLIVVYIFINYINRTKSKNQVNYHNVESTSNIYQLNNNMRKNYKKISYCHNCGKKLDGDLIQFCPYCGEKT